MSGKKHSILIEYLQIKKLEKAISDNLQKISEKLSDLDSKMEGEGLLIKSPLVVVQNKNVYFIDMDMDKIVECSEIIHLT